MRNLLKKDICHNHGIAWFTGEMWAKKSSKNKKIKFFFFLKYESLAMPSNHFINVYTQHT